MDPQAPTYSSTPASIDPPVSPETPKGSKDNHWITILAMALFVLGSLAVVAFLYYQNQQLKNIVASYQIQAVTTPSPTILPTMTPSASPSATPKTTSKVSSTPSSSPVPSSPLPQY